MREESSLEKRLASFSKIFNGLHVEPKNPEVYASYLKMVCDVTEAVKSRDDTNELYSYALKMKEILLEMLSVYDKNM